MTLYLGNQKVAGVGLKYSQKSEIGTWSMPSSNFIELTLGASGNTYVAPANGYFVIDKQVVAAGAGQIWISGNYFFDGRFCSAGLAYIQFTTPACKKGDNIIINHININVNTGSFRFVYAQGDVN